LGYGEWLNAYVYNDTASGTTTITTRLQDIISADPNGVLSANYIYMETNSALVAEYDRDNAKAIDRVKGLLASGDGTDFRPWAFMWLEDRIVRYEAEPTEIHYEHRITDPRQAVTTTTQADVMPWLVRPWNWLQVTDFMVGRATSTPDLHEDPRNILIKSVTFTAPDTMEINGTRIDRLPQLLGQYGLLGLS
jgi:hypothetical protein